jgi:hypothetical protein
MNLPRHLFVKIVTPDNGPPFFEASSSHRLMVETGEEATIGRYMLMETAKFRGEVVRTEETKRKKKNGR